MQSKAVASNFLTRIMKRAPSPWLTIYTNSVTLLGITIIGLALTHLPADRLGLFVFASTAAIAELLNVELFRGSRSRVSVSSVIAIASIPVFGPLAGVLTHMASGVMTVVTTSFRSQLPEQERASKIQRTGFNTGMLVISAALAGGAYRTLQGALGIYAQSINIPALLVAALVDVVANLAILIGVISIQTGVRPLDIWKRDFKWATPIAIAGGMLGGGALALAYQMFSFLGLLVFLLPVLSTTYSFRLYVSNMKVYVDKLEETNLTLDQANLGLLETLGAVIDAYDLYTYGHSAQVTLYAQAIAEKLGLTPDEKALVVKASLVHDVGKIGVMESIIGKQGPLTEEEFVLLRRHTIIGAEIVGRMQGLQEIVPLVLHHHERWDGRGYPDGLEGEEIPLGARIIALADALDAMFSDRPYRSPLTFREVLVEVENCSGTQFDPQVVDAFFALVGEKEREFFKNSATNVDQMAGLSSVSRRQGGVKYLKRSMVSELKN